MDTEALKTAHTSASVCAEKLRLPLRSAGHRFARPGDDVQLDHVVVFRIELGGQLGADAELPVRIEEHSIDLRSRAILDRQVSSP